MHTAVDLDTSSLQTAAQLRALDSAELARLGEDSLRSHLVNMAMVAHQVYAPFSTDRLDSFLEDRKHVRYPVEIHYGIGAMAPHQFAQPELHDDGYKLFIHPRLQNHHSDVAMAVAYFVPVINFGKLVDDDLCLLYGATLSGIPYESYYAELCRIADSVGATARDRTANGDRF